MGSQQHPVKLLMDTRGGQIWTQCQPCKNCFPQNLAIYDPRVSTTYGKLPCDHPLCHGDGRRYNCVDGIFGLSMAPESMLTQFSHLIQARFSYCFVPFSDVIPHPLVLSVANHRLGFPPYTFHVRTNGLGGCFIDSGALFTTIDSDTLGVNAYEIVLSVFEAYYGSRYLQRKTTGTPEGFDLCYDHPSFYNDFATITFHFNGADYTVDGQYVHVFDPGFFCVGIMRGNFGTVLGAWHQQNKRIIYDVGMGALEFADEQCVNDVL
ncbi:hypothetical protein REPUB_Repub05bG0037700 [Reevesia pubescens]